MANKTGVLVGMLLFLPLAAHAQVVITEIMYDLSEGSDSGREWIEVYNVGASSVDLTGWKIAENNTNHTIAATNGKTLAPGAYAVIADTPAKFKADWPAYPGLLFDSAFSLNNTGETIGLTNSSGAAVESVTYTNTAGNGTGDSLQRDPTHTTFDAGVPTPGLPIPAGGLVKIAPTADSRSKDVGGALFPSDADIRGEPMPTAQVAAAATRAQTSSFAWWFGPILVALLASLGLTYARHLKKDEWDIIEEVAETG